MQGQLRQGDVLLVPVKGNEPPASAEPKCEVILARGELTGHAHRLAAPEVYDWEADGQRYVRVTGAVGTLAHEEHDPVPAAVVEPDTTYRVVPQKEWNLEGQWKQVVD